MPIQARNWNGTTDAKWTQGGTVVIVPTENGSCAILIGTAGLEDAYNLAGAEGTQAFIVQIASSSIAFSTGSYGYVVMRPGTGKIPPPPPPPPHLTEALLSNYSNLVADLARLLADEVYRLG